MKLIINTMCFAPDDYQAGTGELVVIAAPGLKIEDYNTRIIANLIERDIDLKTAQKYRIRQAAKKLIESIAWRIERARERAEIGASGEGVNEVLVEREAIRKASNRIESQIDEMTDEADIRAASLVITDDDQIIPKIISKLQFFKRFSSEERSTLRTAIKSGDHPKIYDWFELLSFTQNINLDDPYLVSSLYFLESKGILGKGRADDILTK